VIDLHCHTLPGIDDGPPDLATSVQLVRAAADAGIDAIVATPHVSWQWPNTEETIAGAMRELTAELARESIPVQIHAGAEVALARAFELADQELHGLRLGGGPWILVEAPHARGATGVENMLNALQQRGHRLLLAHVERCPAFVDDGDVLVRLVRGGMLASITASSLSGRFGRPARQAAQRFLAAGLIHNVSSDAHDCRGRPPGLLGHLEAAGLGAQVSWLTEEVPHAVLTDASIPPAPQWPAAPRRRLFPHP